MSRFFSEKYRDLTPYTPGEQPRDQAYIKLNTNESPFAPPASVAAAAAREAARLQLYPDPECAELRAALAEQLGVRPQRRSAELRFHGLLRRGASGPVS